LGKGEVRAAIRSRHDLRSVGNRPAKNRFSIISSKPLKARARYEKPLEQSGSRFVEKKAS